MTGRPRDPRAALRLPTAISRDIRGAVPADLGPVRRVMEVWDAAVGASLARFARPARLTAAGVLTVHAADASWVHAITLEQRTILARLNEHLAGTGPTEMRVEIGPVDSRPEPVERVPTTILPAAQTAAAAMVEEVSDPRLKAALQRAIGKSLSRP